jgi:hypothetical protein
LLTQQRHCTLHAGDVRSCSGSGLTANRENRLNASGSYLFLDASCSPQPVPRKLTLTGPLGSSQSRGLGISASPANGLRVISLCLVRHRPSPACAVFMNTDRLWLRVRTSPSQGGEQSKSVGVHGLSARQHSRCFGTHRRACARQLAPSESPVSDPQWQRSSSPSRTRRLPFAVSVPTFVGTGLLSCDHGLSPGLSTNWENIRMSKNECEITPPSFGVKPRCTN